MTTYKLAKYDIWYDEDDSLVLKYDDRRQVTLFCPRVGSALTSKGDCVFDKTAIDISDSAYTPSFVERQTMMVYMRDGRDEDITDQRMRKSVHGLPIKASYLTKEDEFDEPDKIKLVSIFLLEGGTEIAPHVDNSNFVGHKFKSFMLSDTPAANIYKALVEAFGGDGLQECYICAGGFEDIPLTITDSAEWGTGRVVIKGSRMRDYKLPCGRSVSPGFKIAVVTSTGARRFRSLA
ncbi:hypothetical protein [Mesorhizobium retamae]|uniref:Uncharacterized protein n=1 Tax=Mesorhizobium retamae TaxID=2912854 RepID=A0ABS9QMJ0_9HYPH|nr:hypothetical protein [Mesorhizobium sp. IRAMC:0171]MCG7508631.1 hypothetical protein [Mesorhizobium sp. IRAMC:0171]